MSLEALVRAAEAAGYATVSDDNPDLPLSRAPDPVETAKTEGLIAKAIATVEGSAVGQQAAVWGRASFGQLLPAWASRGQ